MEVINNTMQKYIEKANVLIEALPYIKEFSGNIFVIKYGGSAMLDERLKQKVFQDIVLLKRVGIYPVIVHGGGPSINNMLHEIGKEPEFVDGLRITDAKTMEVVEMVLSGKVNKDIVSNLQVLGVNAVGVSGKDGNILTAKKKYINGKDAGQIGEVEKVNTDLIKALIDNDFIPVIAPVGKDCSGNGYNINADYAASAIAGALNANKLVYLTDVPGVLKDVNDSESLISRMTIKEVASYIEQKIISGGMIPKVECCVSGVEAGVKTVHILDGRVEHSLLLEIFTHKGIGTQIEK